jgi:hypothetical protein
MVSKPGAPARANGSAIESSAATPTGFGGGNVPAAIGPRSGSESTGAGTGGGSAHLDVASRPTTSGAGAGGGVLPGQAVGGAAGPAGWGEGGGSVDDLDVTISPPIEERGAEIEDHGVHLSGPSES